MRKDKDIIEQIEKEIFNDNFSVFGVCNRCHKEKGLTKHHVLKKSQHPELKYDKDNCIMLCRDCHDIIHNIRRKNRK